MATTLLEEIQRDASNEAITVSQLLRRVKLASAKLGLPQVEAWVEHELKGHVGYSGTELPKYRVVSGTPSYYDAFRGTWRPLAGYVDELSQRNCLDPITSIEELIRKHDGKGHTILPFSADIAKELDKLTGEEGTRYGVKIDSSQLVKVVGAVRDLVIDWTLQLEASGVAGQSDFSFSPKEQEAAQSSAATINIGSVGNFAGNLGVGNASGAISTSGVDSAALVSLLGELRKNQEQLVDAIGVPDIVEKLDEIEQALSQSPPQTERAASVLSSIHNAAEGAAGSLLASGVTSLISRTLGV